MDSVLLSTFLKVAELGSFTDAALTLDVAQSTVTDRVRRLEAELGAPLFDRSGARIELTPSGRVYTRFAERALRVLLDGRQAVDGMSSSRSRRVSFMSSPVPAAAYLSGFLAELGRQAGVGELPMVTLSVGSSKQVFRQVRDGLVDVGVTNLNFSHPNVTSELMAEQELTLVYLPPAAAASAKQTMPPAPLYYYEEELEDSLRMQAVAEELGIRRESVVGIGDIGVLKSLLQAGVGSGLVPRPLVQAELAAGTLLEYGAPWRERLPRQVTCLLVRRDAADNPLSPTVHKLADLLRSVLLSRGRGAGQ